jgi:hypothetical protein
VRPVVLAAFAYVAATVAMGWTVIAALGSAIASDAGDPLLNAAILAWNATHVPWTDGWFQFPIFYPTRDALTLSEHLLGVSVVASPFIWLTGNPAIAYNITLLLSYPLSGLAMYALVWRLTRSSPAAFVAGLAFAFAPYRAGQLPHIQMLAMFWAPLALLGLHGLAEAAGRPAAGRAPQPEGGDPEPANGPDAAAGEPGNRWRAAPHSAGGGPDRARGRGPVAGGPGFRWLALFAVCWLLQGAANGYMLVYFSLLVGLWTLWFLAARHRWRAMALVAIAAVAAALPLLPILFRYVMTRRTLGLSRNLGEISAFGADLAAPLCAAPVLSFWGWLRVACAPEGELFPGLALIALCLTGVLVYKRRMGGNADGVSRPEARHRHQRRTGRAVRHVVVTMALVLAAVFAAIAISAWAIGPWRLDLGWLRASTSSADKPLSTALVLLLAAGLLSDRFRSALARGSTLTFYTGAAGVCWVLSWGPFPRLFGEPILYQAPYAWLLQLPGMDALRVPARFWMLAVLCLSVVAGLVMAQLVGARRRRTAAALVALVSAALLVDGWTMIPAVPLPRPVAADAALQRTPVLVTPAGDVFRDAATVYHAIAGGWTTINGYSGYEPGYYEALRTLSRSGSEAQYEPFVRRGDLLVVSGRGVTRIPARPGAEAAFAPSGGRLDIRIASTSCSPAEARYAIDGDRETIWVCGLQDAEHQITIELGEGGDVGAVVYALGSAGSAFPRRLVVETSADATGWDAVWEGSVAALVLPAAMDEPLQTRIVIPFNSRPARFVRLRQIGRSDSHYWAIAELEVWSGPE